MAKQDVVKANMKFARNGVYLGLCFMLVIWFYILGHGDELDKIGEIRLVLGLIFILTIAVSWILAIRFYFKESDKL